MTPADLSSSGVKPALPINVDKIYKNLMKVQQRIDSLSLRFQVLDKAILELRALLTDQNKIWELRMPHSSRKGGLFKNLKNMPTIYEEEEDE